MRALIHIKGTQKIEGQEPDVTELTTAGTLTRTADGWDLRYDETEATGLKGTTTTVHVTKDRVLLERTGANASILVLEKNRRHHSNYSTPYGLIDLGSYATHVEYDLTESGGTLEFSYTLGFNGNINSAHTVQITVQEEPLSCQLS